MEQCSSREVHEEFATEFLGRESAPMLGLRGCSWWLLETDLSLKPPCPVMSPVRGLLAAWELHKMLSWHDPHIPWLSHWETLSSLYTICLNSDQVTPGGQKRGCKQRFQTLCLQPRGAGDSPGGCHSPISPRPMGTTGNKWGAGRLRSFPRPTCREGEQ